MLKDALFAFFALVGFLVCAVLLLAVCFTMIGVMGPAMFFVLALALIGVAASLAQRKLFTTGRKANHPRS